MAERISDEELTAMYIEELKKTYRAFVSFCEKHNFIFYACGGTMIGAVRHKGLIPWDDDIDVLMSRSDYNQFLALKSQMLGSGYEILDWRTKGYGLPFAKFCNANSTVIPKENSQISYGVFIDVFPIDEVDGTIEEILKKCNNYRVWLHAYMACNSRLCLKTLFNRGPHNLSSSVGHIFARVFLQPFKKCIERRILKLERTIFHGDMLCSPFGAYKKGEVFEKSWFISHSKCKFEDSYIYLPNGYHEYLTNMFGNYMQLPPEDDRVSNHSLFYTNFKRRLTPEQVKSNYQEAKFDGFFSDREGKKNAYDHE